MNLETSKGIMAMQGLGGMLKMLGVDPDTIAAQAKAIVGEVAEKANERLVVIEDDIREIKEILVRIDAHYVPSEMRAQVVDQSTLVLTQAAPLPFENDGSIELPPALTDE